jgi:hypothetical protein
MKALASFKDQGFRIYGNDLHEREESRELSLVLDVSALRDELQGLSSVTETQLGVIQEIRQAVWGIGTSENLNSTGEAHLKKACNRLDDMNAEFQSLKADTDEIETGVSGVIIESYNLSVLI